jgi:hypothetical protein
MTIDVNKLEKTIRECRKHKQRLEEAAEDMEHFIPLDSISYGRLSKEQVRIIDQFLFRFSKLQDVIGKKLFKEILLVLGEDIEDLPFIDMLNRLEKIHLFEDVERWFELRQLRNELSHEYEDDPGESSAIINKIYEQAETLIGYFTKIDEYYKEKMVRSK